MVEPYTAIEIIHAKRDKQSLSTEQLRWLIDAYMRGVVADEQMSAFTMATVLNGMERSEILALTQAMVDSGERLDFSGLGAPTADKHSTGGIGDKITLPLMPLVASYGVKVPQLSGRGLGYTGGTLDKLESISGWRASLSNDELYAQLRDVGGVVCAAGSGLAPADARIYALRDATGTVESKALIAASIMSKKLAEGTGVLVLDVKFGTGAFMRTLEDAAELARILVDIGQDAGVATSALLTDMSTPLGHAIGNANEVEESLEVLAGGGPADVVELTVELAREMLAGAGITGVDPAEHLADGSAMDVWRRFVVAQGGDADAPLPQPAHTETVTAPTSGTVTRTDALGFGIAAWRLGAGRARKEDAVQHAAGIDLHVKPGDTVTAGQPLFTLRADDEARMPLALEAVDGAWTIDESGAPFDPPPLIRDRVR